MDQNVGPQLGNRLVDERRIAKIAAQQRKRTVTPPGISIEAGHVMVTSQSLAQMCSQQSACAGYRDLHLL
jgi:hypothetical protein